jgi:hypothetical protein
LSLFGVRANPNNIHANSRAGCNFSREKKKAGILVSFNLGISNHPSSRLGGLSSIGIYLYEDIYYRQWITEVALAFYEGRQDEFVWLDLVKQFRNPEKQQIIPINLTKEIIDETSILYREDPIYQVIDKEGRSLPKDQKLWEKVMKDSRYLMVMDKLDRWTRLLGTVLVKVGFVDPNTGRTVNSTSPGIVQLDLLHGGVYDLRHGASPYYITELMIGFGNKFNGFAGGPMGGGVAKTIPSPSNLGQQSIEAKNAQTPTGMQQPLNRIFWSPTSHMTEGDDGYSEIVNPYGIVPAVPFFNQDPAHYYFLPINEPLIYANHANNMRMTDLNHIAKFQSFGVPVVKGVERPTSVRQGRPVDDFNQLKGGTAQSRFGGIGGVSGFAAGGGFRNFDTGLGIFRDGNADANALGFSLGPDTAVAVGEKGDFKFEHPNADITGLIKVIQSMTDMVRINHGLRPKYKDTLPSSGFALLMEKIGVIEENIRRSKLFAERERQLFHVIKTLWNTHNREQGQERFSDDADLHVTHRPPEFPVDPKTAMETIIIENTILDAGDRSSYKKLYPYMSEVDINLLIKKRRKDKLEQATADAEVQIAQMSKLEEAGFDPSAMSGGKSKDPKEKKDSVVSKPKIDNKAKHSEDSSKQPKKNGDTRRSAEEK